MSDGNGGDPAVVIERRSGGGGAGLFLLGLAVGAGLALLFAPKTGEETRAAVTRQVRRMRRKARDLAESKLDLEDDGV